MPADLTEGPLVLQTGQLALCLASNLQAETLQMLTVSPQIAYMSGLPADLTEGPLVHQTGQPQCCPTPGQGLQTVTGLLATPATARHYLNSVR